ncbi:hypothetical protein [Legionella impletisoli]|uniref:Uncharacterized protein n=1 Tax=Legionella impletisoli TaxID=343510 RepID=A0A917JWQ2_9GAMM|nr:hypothetical protein [Legionella impletisoli]GGI90228.1 hypothetical protein GCM10007966_18780 [Legionella impletisoli]
MGKVIVSGGKEGGEARLLNLALFNYFTETSNAPAAEKLKQCYQDPTVKLYLVDIRRKEETGEKWEAYDLVAFNKEGKSRCFTIEADANLQVKGLQQIKPKELGEMGKEFYDYYKQELTTGEKAPEEPTPDSSPRPSR